MQRYCLRLSFITLFLLLPVVAQAQAFSEDCNLTFQGKYRKAVKNRKAADGAGYKVHNDGNPISVKQWFTLACGLDPKVKGKSILTGTKTLAGVETIQVTLEGFLLGAKFERHVKKGDNADNDFHLEMSDSKKWNSKHVIVEVPPGAEYCEARQQIFALIKAAGCGGDKCIFKTPTKIQVTGFVFLDGAHGKTCKIKRGMEVKGVSGAEGAWEIHPVLQVKKIE